MQSRMRYPYGQSNFANLINQGFHFVDKTPFIEKLEQSDESYVIFLRPRRFGKSLFISMLEYYYGTQHEKDFDTLFGKFYIGQHPTPRKNSYWILKFNFSGINTQSIEDTKEGFLVNIRKGINIFIHRYLNWPKEKTQAVLKQKQASSMLQALLAELSFQSHQPIYVLIDEYDHFTNELMAFDFVSFEEFVGRNGFIRKFYEVLKIGTGDGTIDRIFITGVSPITVDSLTSGFNIAKKLGVRVDFNEMMGFTEDEVITLLKGVKPKGNISVIMDDLRKWYDGYLFDRDAIERMYNADMVLYFLTEYSARKRYPDEMIDTNIASDYGKLRRLFSLKTPEKNYEVLRQIIEGKPQYTEIVQEFSFERAFNENDFLSLLFYLGFLTIANGRTKVVQLRMPNYVIQKLYFDFFISRLTQQQNISFRLSQLQRSMLEMAYEGSPEPFFQEIEYVLGHLSRRDYQNFNEKQVKAIIMALAIQVDTFFVKSEREYQGGYTDIVFLQRPPFDVHHQYIFELKYLKKEQAKDLANSQKKAKIQLLNYLNTDEELKSMKDLQAWTIIVVKDKVFRERVN